MEFEKQQKELILEVRNGELPIGVYNYSEQKPTSLNGYDTYGCNWSYWAANLVLDINTSKVLRHWWIRSGPRYATRFRLPIPLNTGQAVGFGKVMKNYGKTHVIACEERAFVVKRITNTELVLIEYLSAFEACVHGKEFLSKLPEEMQVQKQQENNIFNVDFL